MPNKIHPKCSLCLLYKNECAGKPEGCIRHYTREAPAIACVLLAVFAGGIEHLAIKTIWGLGWLGAAVAWYMLAPRIKIARRGLPRQAKVKKAAPAPPTGRRNREVQP